MFKKIGDANPIQIVEIDNIDDNTEKTLSTYKRAKKAKSIVKPAENVKENKN